MRSNLKSFGSSTTQHGFSMLEILITLVIVAIALLGTAGLQVNAMRMNKGGQFRTQAIFLASDIAERMEANRAEAVLGTYAVAATSAVGAAATLCDAAACSSTQLAAWDISQWGTSITNLLPQPSWSITQTAAGNPSTYSIVINWTDRSNVKSVNSGAIVDTYTATRTIGN
jgi:type IV pilus assembly protein PilV